MANVGTYLNFKNQTEEAFNFYKSIFGGEFDGGFSRFGEIPPSVEMPPISDEDKNLVMHVTLPILGGHRLMGSDVPGAFGSVNVGNNVNISLSPDTREETKRLFTALSDGGHVIMDLQDTFWEAYYGSCVDKYGVHWMLNCIEKA